MVEDVLRADGAVDGHGGNTDGRRVVVAQLQRQVRGIVLASHELIIHVLADVGHSAQPRTQGGVHDLVVVSGRHVAVLRLVVFNEWPAGVLSGHVRGDADDVGDVRAGLRNRFVIHLRDAQLHLAAAEAVERHHDRSAREAGLHGLGERHPLAVGLLALRGGHFHGVDGLGTLVLDANQAVGGLLRQHHAVVHETGDDGHVVELALGVLDGQQNGQDAPVFHVHPARIPLQVVVPRGSSCGASRGDRA